MPVTVSAAVPVAAVPEVWAAAPEPVLVGDAENTTPESAETAAVPLVDLEPLAAVEEVWLMLAVPEIP